MMEVAAKQDEPVCEICGSGSDQKVIANCGQCNGYVHSYCMPVVTFVVPDVWCCDECQNKSNGKPSPSQDAQTTMLDNNLSNMVNQVGVKIPKKFENAKVKFISCEEAALLNNKERPKFPVQPAYSQVHPPASPPKLKFSPSRRDTQVSSLKRCAASQSHTKIAHINKKEKAQSGAMASMLLPCSRSSATKGEIDFQNELREKKVISADKGKMNSQIQDDRREKIRSNVTDADIGFGSETSPYNNIGTLVVINSSVEYARRPPPEHCWTGCFLVLDGANGSVVEFKAYFPSKVSSKVYDVAKNMPKDLKFEMLAQTDDCPKYFVENSPVYEDIGLVFFSAEPCTLKIRRNSVMRAYINNIKLMIYSSEMLPPDSQWIDGEIYLWGVFVNSKRRHYSRQFGSIIGH